MKPRTRTTLALAAMILGLSTSIAAPSKRIALVFDDGPVPADAEPLLALLAKEQVPVTFSLVGDRVREHPALAKAILAAGHEVANHSQTHAHPKDLSDDALEREVGAAQKLLTEVLGRAPRWYWPPYLEVDPRHPGVWSRHGLAHYVPRHLVVSRDYDRAVGADEIRRLATTDVRDGSVILFHEWRQETREQLPAILAELRRQGCEFFTFSGLEAALGAAGPSAAVARAPAPAPTEVPPGGRPMFDGKLKDFRFFTLQGSENAATFSTREAQGPGFKQVLRVETTRDLSPPWAVALHVTLAGQVKRGDTGFVRFHARAPSSADETGLGRLRVVVQQAAAPYKQSLDTQVTMGPEWQEFMLPFSFAEDYGVGEIDLGFGFGFKRETVEIGGIEVLHFGTAVSRDQLPRTRFTYRGREADAPWRAAALARIEQVRKSGFVIVVQDATGAAVPGYTIKVEQKRSAFQFGTAVQAARLVQDSPDNRRYRELLVELFNAASPENDLKWPAWAGEWSDAFNRTQTLRALGWLRDQGLHLRGHVLVWPGWKHLPASLGALKGTPRQAEIPGLVLQHIADLTAATREFVQEWDVLNEPYDNRDLMGLFGNDIMLAWFKAAAEGAPGVPLYLNDYSNHDFVAHKAHAVEFFRVAKFLREKGAPLGGLGLQGHIGAVPNPPENVLATLDAYAELKLPIRFTEFDIETDDEQLQADYTRDFLILAYSHPSVVGVQHWGFWARAHWRPKGALFRADWTAKPAGQVYRELVLNQWRTRLQGKAGKTGRVAGRGFHGDYLVVVEHEGKRVEQTFSLRPDEAKTTVSITLP